MASRFEVVEEGSTFSARSLDVTRTEENSNTLDLGTDILKI